MTKVNLTISDYIRIGAEKTVIEHIHRVSSAVGKLDFAMLATAGRLDQQINVVLDELTALRKTVEVYNQANSIEAKLNNV